VKIEYRDADGRVLELEVSDDIGQFYLSSVEETKRSDRRNTRPDRHTSLETFVYEDKKFFASTADPMREAVEGCEVDRLLSCLSDRQKDLVRRCVIEGWTYTEVAAQEGKDESAVRHAVKRALKKIKKTFF